MESDNEFECVAVIHSHTQDVKSVHWHPSKEVQISCLFLIHSQILFSCSYDDTIKIFQDEEDDWYCSSTLTGHTSTVWDFAFDRTGDRIVSCGDDKNLIVWDVKTTKESTCEFEQNITFGSH